ncbi:Elongation factor p, partial [Nymphaea thermarum]
NQIRLGNIIQRKGRIYQVLKAQHTQHGRGGATIQVELRDVDSGNKVTERFRTDEAIERVFVEEKSFTFLYQEGESVMIMEPSTFEQLEVSKELFGKGVAYLKDNMTVTLQFYDGKPMSASVPQRVTCTVVEAQPVAKGQTASPQYKRVALDNGLTVLAPSFIKTGDLIVVNTMDDSYMTRKLLNDDIVEPLYVSKHPVVITSDEVYGNTLPSKPTTPTNSMEVVFRLCRKIIVDNQRNLLDVNSTSQKICGNQNA